MTAYLVSMRRCAKIDLIRQSAGNGAGIAHSRHYSQIPESVLGTHNFGSAQCLDRDGPIDRDGELAVTERFAGAKRCDFGVDGVEATEQCGRRKDYHESDLQEVGDGYLTEPTA